MKIDPTNEDAIIIHASGVGTVTREMVRARAAELAVINGRAAQDVSVSDLAQAKRELTGEPELDPKEVALEAAPESERWDPLPGSTGHVVTIPPDEEEDAEGRSLGERLVEEGVEEAGHDQMLKAAQAIPKRDRREP